MKFVIRASLVIATSLGPSLKANEIFNNVRLQGSSRERFLVALPFVLVVYALLRYSPVRF